MSALIGVSPDRDKEWLLGLASQHFDVFITVDRNLSFQQNLAAFHIGVVVLQARSNRLADLRPLAPRAIAAIERVRPGAIALIGQT